jgi:AraC-like DNA-binding protein
MISITAAVGLAVAIEEAGGSPDGILKAAGLEPRALADRDGFMPALNFAAALDRAAEVTGDDCFGLHFGEQYHPKEIGALTYVVLNSPTIAVAFGNVARYLRVHNEAARVSFTCGGRFAYLRHGLPDIPFSIRRQHQEYSLAVGIGALRLMAGTEWAPVEVQFEHAAPPDTAEHTRVFGAPVAFGCKGNAFVIERDFCAREIPAADRRLYGVLERQLDRLLDEAPPDDGLQSRVRRAVARAVRHGDPPLAQVAAAVGCTPRTLQRRLREAGTDFKALVDDTRHRLAMRHLRQRRHTLTDIAYLLGYSEVSAFNRAFRRWTGSTPSSYRRAPRSR